MKKMPLSVLNVLANVICGDTGPGKYRTGTQIGDFLHNINPNIPPHDGSTRRIWTLNQLRTCNEDSVGSDIESIILALTDPREYFPDIQQAENVRVELNRLLALDGLKIVMRGVKPELTEVLPYICDQTITKQLGGVRS